MSTQPFKIRRELLIPLGISAGLLLILLILTLLGKGSSMERIFLTAMTIPTVALFLEARNRRATMTDQGILFKKFLRVKEILWGDISHVGCVMIRKKVYLLLTTTKGFFILSNAYEDFSALIRIIVERVGPDKVEEDVRAQGENPVKNRWDMISLWFAVVVIFGIILLKLLPI
jgi:hypothetical protein